MNAHVDGYVLLVEHSTDVICSAGRGAAGPGSALGLCWCLSSVKDSLHLQQQLVHAAISALQLLASQRAAFGCPWIITEQLL